MAEIPTPNPRARGLSEDQRIRLRDLEQTSHLSDMETGEIHALRLVGNTEESVRADRVIQRVRRERAADRSASDIGRGLLGGGGRS